MMLMSHHLKTSALLIISGALLASLIPGGPIETRDFSHINPLVLAGFNLYLTVLGLGSFVLAMLVYKKQRTYGLPFLAGCSFLVVYLIDLLGVFPKASSQMSSALWAIEMAGMFVSLPLIWESLSLRLEQKQQEKKQIFLFWGWGVLMIFGGGIVVFATLAAMGK